MSNTSRGPADQADLAADQVRSGEVVENEAVQDKPAAAKAAQPKPAAKAAPAKPAAQTKPVPGKAAAKPGSAKPAPAKAVQGKPVPGKAAQGKPAQPVPSEPRPPRPITVTVSAAIMCVGAALSLLGAVLSSIGISRLTIAELHKSMPKDTVAQLHTVQHNWIVSVWVSAAIVTILWLAVALLTYRGAPWVRIVATALLALNTFNAVPGLLNSPGISTTIYTAAVWLVGAAATALLWLPASNAYLRPPPRDPNRPVTPSFRQLLKR